MSDVDIKNPSPPKRRRLLRFSLRGLSVAVLILCVLLRVIVPYKQREAKESAAMDVINSVYGTGGEENRTEFYYGYQLGEIRNRPSASAQGVEPYARAKPPTPRWVRRLFGPNTFSTIKRIHFPFVGNTPSGEEIVAVKNALQEFENLESLQLDGSRMSFLDADAFRSMQHLRALNLDGFWELTDISGLSNLKKLESVNLNGTNIKSIAPLAGIVSLKHLSLKGCFELRNVDELAQLSNLNSLDIFCERLDSIEFLSSLRQLEFLSVSDDSSSTFDILSIVKNENLQHLKLHGFNSINNLGLLDEFKNLKTLEFHNCSGLISLATLPHLPLLKSITLHNCHLLKSLEGIEVQRELEEIEIYFCKELLDLDAIGMLPSIRSIILRSMGFERFPKLRKHQHLKSIDIDSCRSLINLDRLDELDAPNLESFSISDCTNLSDIRVLELPSTAWLTILSCPKVSAESIKSVRE